MFTYNGRDCMEDTFNLLLDIMQYDKTANKFNLDCHLSFATQSLMESHVDSDISVMAIPRLDDIGNIRNIIQTAIHNRYTILYYPAGSNKATTTRNIVIDIDKFDSDRIDDLKTELENIKMLKYTNICTSGGGLHIYILTDYDTSAVIFERMKTVFEKIANKLGMSIDNSITLNSRMRCPFSPNTKYSDRRFVLCIQRAKAVISYNELKRVTDDVPMISEYKTIPDVKELHHRGNIRSNKLNSDWQNILAKIIEKNNNNRNKSVFNMFVFLIENNIITTANEFCDYIDKLTSDKAFEIYNKKDNTFNEREVLNIAKNVYNMKKKKLNHDDLSDRRKIPSFIKRGDFSGNGI